MCCHSQSRHMMIPIRVLPPPPWTSVRISAGLNAEGSLYWQQTHAFTTAADPYSMQTGHSPNHSRKNGVFCFWYRAPSIPFFIPSSHPRTEQTGQARPKPKDTLRHLQHKSNLKHNFSSSPSIFLDDLGTLQKSYAFASTAAPS